MTKTAKTPKVKNTKAAAAEAPRGEYKIVPIMEIMPSSSVPQEARRLRMTEASLTALSESIREEGIVEPLIVRRLEKGYELVAGERRWRAGQMANLSEVPVLIRELDDQQALKVQFTENENREDTHPLDKAMSYKYLMDEKKMTIPEVAAFCGVEEIYVVYLLPLNKLTDEVKKDFVEDFLPTGQALEIAKYPAEAQLEILKNYAYVMSGMRESGAKPLVQLKNLIDERIRLNLKKAPFSETDENLLENKLKCTSCTENTAYEPRLFENRDTKKTNYCLNKSCFLTKLNNFVNIQVIKASEAGIKESGNAEYQAPILINGWSEISDIPQALTRYRYQEITNKKEKCKFAELGVFINGDRIAQKQLICRSAECEEHGRGFRTSTGQTPKTNSEAVILQQQEERRIRKEELFDIRVGEPVRRKVLKLIADKFDEKTTIFNYSNNRAYEILLLTRLWQMQCQYSGHTAGIIREILDLKDDKLGAKSWGHNYADEITNLGAALRSKLYFLLITAYECELSEGCRYQSQKAIKNLAIEYGVDYHLLDAEERITQAPLKHKDMFRGYLQKLINGDRSAEIPRMFSTKWIPEDK